MYYVAKVHNFILKIKHLFNLLATLQRNYFKNLTIKNTNSTHYMVEYTLKNTLLIKGFTKDLLLEKRIKKQF